MAQCHQSQHQHEFLPLCDVLFNIISLASYFCDVVFDFAMVYALAHQAIAPPVLFPLSITLIATSLLISQIISLRWYLWGARGKLTNNNVPDECDASPVKKTGNWMVGCVLLLHSTQVGVLWRYFKLFIPVNLTYVKHEVRELCVLRLIHAFCEAAPMLLLQLYLLSIGVTDDGETEAGKPKDSDGKDSSKLAKLTAVSAGLSLWSVCWAVASFSKGAARLRNLERLVLTWLGVLAQLAWRLGTVSARVGALVVYASLYGGQWLLIVMALHWLSMLTWLLLTPDGLFHGGERLPLIRKTFLASLLAFVYIFAYVNLHETNHRQKMVIFYTVMFLENSLLIGVWVAGVNRTDLMPHQHHPHPVTLVLILLALFFGGMFFMGLYYRFFHVRRLRYEAGGRMTGSNLTTLSNQDNSEEKQIDYNEEKKVNISIGMRKVKLSNGGIPGVFNCRFANPTAVNPNRKKKKPTTFVPPPPPQSQSGTVMSSVTTVGDSKQWLNVGNGSRQLIPFWKKPISSSNVAQNDNSNERKDEADMAVGGSLNVTLIREKLKEKKQQQLRELRAIQEEIKEGKLFPPPSANTSSFSTSPSASNQQPPPNTKLHTSPNSPLFTSPPSFEQNGGGILSSWPPVKMHCLLPPPPSSPYYHNPHPSNPWRAAPQRERADTPEILLAPRCLPHHYSHWSPPGHLSHRLHTNQNGADESSKGEGEGEAEISDMEGSQVSLPRSYTLPREFKYNHPNNAARERERRIGNNKVPPSRFYLPSTNSSDGDVDSADNEDETDSEAQIRMKINHGHNHDEAVQRRHVYENNEENNTAGCNTQCGTSNVMTNNCYPNNSHGALRPNQLFRTRVKHETKL
ncbi:uncharacterized protein LOC105183515 [Harpegnathos saltator]|uniref:XK-related protein n=1 Tax=Harpegnathos saltator TaxID=610380 RepID=E2BJI5_HARSA|nr:uncharacterized protein LOC105183515 [Harpegnathos saltator]XP_011140023.1 uncharacterized protein LOC105183515 [Harpegnathos saltator]XP_019697182.1 uncharacterized protein LOC105183515 [Harpegnathos saltator]EFN84142.1 XK-related protein 7 [Harpegnathos saltator]